MLSTFIKLPFVIKIFVLSIFEWRFYTGFTVFHPNTTNMMTYAMKKFFHFLSQQKSSNPKHGSSQSLPIWSKPILNLVDLFHPNTTNMMIYAFKNFFHFLSHQKSCNPNLGSSQSDCELPGLGLQLVCAIESLPIWSKLILKFSLFHPNTTNMMTYAMMIYAKKKFNIFITPDWQ